MSGSTADLAKRASVQFASAHAELKAMQRLGLVESQRDGRSEVYRANAGHPDAEILRSLVASDRAPALAPAAGDDQLKRALKRLGAPLRGVTPLETDPPVLETLVQGVRLARRDPVVARTIPVCVWNARDSLDASALRAAAISPEDKHVLGFFLELTDQLGGDRRLVGLAEVLRDRRLTSTRPFFHSFSPKRDAAAGTFPLAQKWGFHMNMDLDSFRSLFDKFVVR